MPHCTKCGAMVAEGTAFCGGCGQPVSSGGSAAPAANASASAQTGLQENIAGLLCYVLGWITGLIFILIDKRPFVKFHAAQSIVLSGAITIINFALLRLFPGGVVITDTGISTSSGAAGIVEIIWVLTVVLGLFLMYQAYQGKRYKLPVIGDFAEKLGGKAA